MMSSPHTPGHRGTQPQIAGRNGISCDGRFVPRRSMTFRAVVAASVRRHCTTAEFIVRMELAAHGDDQGAGCRPSEVTLARDSAMNRRVARAALAALRARGEITPQGRDGRGIQVWCVNLPADIPAHIHHRAVLRAFQHHIKPLPRAILIAIAACTDGAGKTNGFGPSMEDLCAWFCASDDAVGRALKHLAKIGLIRLVKRAGGARGDAARYDLTFGPEAMAWVPGGSDSAARHADGDPDWSAKMHRGGPQKCTQPLAYYH